MQLHWPPRALGLGPPLNLVTRSREQRAGFARRASQSAALGVAAAVVVAAIDYLIFNGETARRTPALDAHPTPLARVAITFVGGLAEELFFRVGVATLVATGVWAVLHRTVGERPVTVTAAQWVGTIAAAVYVGVWHVGMASDPGGTARVVTINVVGNLLYGWTYWRRGLELSTLTHGILNGTLYIGLPLLH